MEEFSYPNPSEEKYYTACTQPTKAGMAWRLALMIQLTDSVWMHPYVTLEQIAQIMQPQEPITMTPSLEWLFQQIERDIFQVRHIAYLAYEERLTVWFILYHLKPRSCHHIQIDIHLSTAVPSIWYPRQTVLTAAHLSPPAYSRKTVLSHIPTIQWPGRAHGKNCKEDSEWKYRPSSFLGQWQCHHPAIPKHPNPR